MKKITIKIISLAFGVSLFIGVVLSVLLSISLQKTNNLNLDLLERNMRAEFDLNAKNQVQTVQSLTKAVDNIPFTDTLSIDIKKTIAADLMRELRYGAEGYFWADTKEGVNVVLLGKAAEGKNRYDMQDSKGAYFIREIIKNGQQPDGGFTNYYFPKKGSDEPLPKRGYSLSYEPFDWIIGTGNYVDDIDQMVSEYKDQANSALQRSITISILIVIGLLALSFLAAYTIGTRLSKPIIDISEKMAEISTGNLNVKIDVKQKDEIGRLGDATNNMVVKLREIIQKISTSSIEIMNASGQMSDSSQQLSQGASEQAASTEEVSSSMEQMAANIQQNTHNAKETEQISVGATSGIEQVTNRSKESLDAIRKIAEKIDIINDIASQTNILALNAAVEAARAGEHGKGFAVVAAEVRKLAENSKTAADEIISLSHSSLNIAEEVEKVLTNVLPEIEKTKVLVQEISSASGEQSTGAEQVNSAIQQLNSITQQNAASSEEMASSSEELSAQAENMNQILGFFKTEG